jgi:hypothetical protein
VRASDDPSRRQFLVFICINVWRATQLIRRLAAAVEGLLGRYVRTSAGNGAG